MKSIGFNNFRRFKEMNPIELGGVNMFVGGNNAGKSTVVKGMLLLFDFLKNSRTSFNENPKFRFDGPDSHDVNIDTFRRALCWDTDEKEITFTSILDDFEIIVCIYSAKDVKKEDVAYADVKYFKVYDRESNINLDFQFTESNDNYGVTVTTPKRSYKIKHQKDFWSDSLPDVVSYISGLTNPYYGSYGIVDKNDDESRNDLMKSYDSQLHDIKDRFMKAISKIQIEYIYSHDAGQRILYNKKDENDYVSKSIHEFYNQRITSKSLVGKDFVCKWLLKFCDVSDYRITNIQGEAYQFELKKDGKWVNLADMGRGAIQIVTLLVRIASIIKKYDRDNSHRSIMDTPQVPIVLVEEPEQNMHPSWQSILTEMFYDVYNSYGVRFIIETHSEYLIRKTQVLVANKNYEGEKVMMENNPFKVYFFESDPMKKPRNMEYEISGAFKEKFGPGFFDEASKSDMTIIRKEYELKKKNQK